MPSSYQPGIPTGLVFLDQDYANIQQNFQSLDTYFGVDHTPYSIGTLTDPNGYHQSIHLVPVSTTTTNPPNNQPLSHVSIPPSLPPATPGFGQLFSAQINDGIGGPDEALYYLTGGDKLIQLTRNFTPTVTGLNGATMLPGGLILNWGTTSTDSSGNATVIFTQSFPSTVFSIQLTIKENNTSSRNIKITTIPGPAPFTTFTAHTSTGSLQFTWMAIGI
jgi:hypothetical protein